jgi:hypothetical protein
LKATSASSLLSSVPNYFLLTPTKSGQRLNEIQPALYLYIRGAIRDRVKDKVPETGWSGPIVLQELLSYSIFRQACFSLVSPTLASVHGEYLYSRMKSMEVSNMCLFIYILSSFA